jgi:hypothetical protein
MEYEGAVGAGAARYAGSWILGIVARGCMSRGGEAYAVFIFALPCSLLFLCSVWSEPQALVEAE